jgi:hypothetical protein
MKHEIVPNFISKEKHHPINSQGETKEGMRKEDECPPTNI